jgi:uncharacterized OB-fold protein
MDIPLPEKTPLTAPYWQALDEGHLVVARCDCGHAFLPPRPLCPRCLQAAWRWERASGKGRLVSWVVYHTAYHPAYADRLPYNVALVELDEGPRLITNLVDAPDQLVADAPVDLCIEREQGWALARFRQRAGTDTGKNVTEKGTA